MTTTAMWTRAFVAAVFLSVSFLAYSKETETVAIRRDAETPAVRSSGDSRLKTARVRYAEKLSEIERTATNIVQDALRQARKRAEDYRNREIPAAREALLAEYEVAIEQVVKRGDLEQAERLTLERQSLLGLEIEVVAFNTEEIVDGHLYECVLGIYGHHWKQGPYPIINLSVPNRDLWSEAIQRRLRGKIDFQYINYQGDAKIVVPADGTYTFKIPVRGTSLALNGKSVSAGDIQLRRGVYALHITTGTYGQTWMPGSFVEVFSRATGRPIPLVNSGAEIKRFLARTVEGRPVVEVSGYRPRVVEKTVNRVSEEASRLKR